MTWPVGSEEWKQHRKDRMYKGMNQNKKVCCSRSSWRVRHKDAELQEEKIGDQVCKGKEGRARAFRIFKCHRLTVMWRRKI